MNNIILRKDAKVKGLNRYFSGKPCKNNHLSQRRTNNGSCIECESNYYTNRYQENKEHIKKLSHQWKANNKEHYSLQQKEYYRTNKDRLLTYYKKYNKEQYEQYKQELHQIFQKMAIHIPYDEMGYEDAFKWHIAGKLISTFKVEVFNEYYIDRRSCIDLYIPDLNLGIEVKLDANYWSVDQITEQVTRYQAALNCDVIVVSHKGEFGMDVDQLITFVQDRLRK